MENSKVTAGFKSRLGDGILFNQGLLCIDNCAEVTGWRSENVFLSLSKM